MKKRDSEVISTSSGTSKGSDHRKGSTFSLRRIFHVRRPRNRSKSHASLDSDSARSETSLNVVSEPPPPPLPIVPCPPPSVTAVAQSKRKDNCRECPVCMVDQDLDNFPEIMTCHHRSCRDCLKQYLQIEISESRINIACPECAEKFHPNDIQMILRDELLMTKYEDFMLRRVLAMDPDARWCPAPDCGYAVIATGCAGCPKLKCERPGCNTFFCYHCKQHWHPNQTCDTARAERSPNIRSSSLSYSNESGSQKDDIKPCPRCGAFIVKMNDGSCNHMTCAVCGAEFCWLCMKEISDLHYLSPSGCTFWGKKPWSRKKKILWQLGTLVGAPVGITLVAGIAVPAMIIGIPVWVGRKLHSRYENSPSKHRRNLAITGGVAASILVSPIIAGLAVGIGVPILLAYVYGVVPISLCRSGGCGVTTTNTGGVRFEFDEEAEGTQAGKYADTGDSHSVETGHHVANPSIAPSIGEASVGMTNSLSASGSHMDRVGGIRDESDRDSASNRAIAGSSLNGSLCGSTYTTYQNKLEVQADVSTNHMSQCKRASFSSESANISLSEKSATVSFYDDASTKALAGSIAGYSNKDSTSLSSPPCESHAGDDCVSLCQDCTSDNKSHTSHSECPRKFSASQPNSPGLSRSVSNSFDEVKLQKCRKCTRFQDVDSQESLPGHYQGELNSKSDSDKGIRVPFVTVCEQAAAGSDSGYRESVLSSEGGGDGGYLHGAAHAERLDSCSSHESSKSGMNLPEVETDRPSIGSDSSQSAISLIPQSAKVSDTCLSFPQPSPTSSCSTGESADETTSMIRRRHSCELAYNNGRLSPTKMK
ncbi:E3 ubiquitin-protein ligase RNF19B-like isoform X1 [Haliotis cracherodii]|uniref:E3 ubiquitin-protein ligase RNF19B-like isoform X1 n=1 Tax=Haliotis cracherodii TaxID=6455 RepID=UPI0039E990EE